MIKLNVKNKVVTSILTLSLALGSLLPTTSVFAEGATSLSATKHTISILESDITYLKSDKDGSTPVRMVDRLRDENGMTTFCINFDLPSPPGLEVEGFEQLDNATTYLMNAFYQGNSNLTGDNAVDEYIIQATIHNIKSPNSFSLDRPFIDEKGILPRIKALKEEALNAPAPSIPVYDNGLSVDKNDLTFKLVNGNYESDVVTANVKGDLQSSTIAVENATPSTKLVDEAGKEVKTIANGSKMKLLVPEKELQGKALSPSISLKGHFSNAYKVAVRFGGNEGFQDVASYESKEFSEDKKVTINGQIEAVKGSVKFVKKGTDEKLLDNVKFNVLASDGKTVEKEITTKDGQAQAIDLAYGLHYLVEVGTLPSYVLNGEKIPFTINHNQEVIDLGTVYNKLKEGKIAIHKVDQDGVPLKDAEFTSTDKDGKQEVKLTDSDGNVSFDIEANNVYSVKETKTPDGYLGTFKQENITLENDGQVFEYEAVNTLKKGSIVVHKVDQDGSPLKDAEFTSTDKDGTQEVKLTDADGNVSFDIHANNTYSLEETKNPTGYTGNFKQDDITLENDGQVFEYTVKNTKDKVVTKEITKEVTKETKTFPQTGEKTNTILISVGIGLIAIGAIAFYVLKRQKNKQNNQ